jgi:translation initiation factor IF-3
VKIRKNGDLRDLPRVRVIGASGEMLGVIDIGDALRLARQDSLDLVEVNPKATPPVCRLLDFSKYKYDEAKKAALGRRGDPVLVFLPRTLQSCGSGSTRDIPRR